MSKEKLMDNLLPYLKFSPDRKPLFDEFVSRITYVAGSYDKDVRKSHDHRSRFTGIVCEPQYFPDG